MRGSRIVLTRQWRSRAPPLPNAHPLTATTTNPGTSSLLLRRNWTYAGPPSARSPAHAQTPGRWGNSRIVPRPRLETTVDKDAQVAEDGAKSREVDLGWTREAFQAFLDDKGPAAALARFEELAARQSDTRGRAGTLVEAFKEMRALGIRPSPAFYGLALAVCVELEPVLCVLAGGQWNRCVNYALVGPCCSPGLPPPGDDPRCDAEGLG